MKFITTAFELKGTKLSWPRLVVLCWKPHLENEWRVGQSVAVYCRPMTMLFVASETLGLTLSSRHHNGDD